MVPLPNMFQASRSNNKQQTTFLAARNGIGFCLVPRNRFYRKKEDCDKDTRLSLEGVPNLCVNIWLENKPLLYPFFISRILPFDICNAGSIHVPVSVRKYIRRLKAKVTRPLLPQLQCLPFHIHEPTIAAQWGQGICPSVLPTIEMEAIHSIPTINTEVHAWVEVSSLPPRPLFFWAQAGCPFPVCSLRNSIFLYREECERVCVASKGGVWACCYLLLVDCLSRILSSDSPGVWLMTCEELKSLKRHFAHSKSDPPSSVVPSEWKNPPPIEPLSIFYINLKIEIEREYCAVPLISTQPLSNEYRFNNSLSSFVPSPFSWSE